MPQHNSHRLDVSLRRDFLDCPGCSTRVADRVLGADEAFFWCSSDYLTTASSNNVDSDGAAAAAAALPRWLVLRAALALTLSLRVLWAGGGGPGGGTGMDLLSPTPWLLTYWMGRHHGLLAQPAEPGLVAGK